jgi:ubiquinone/menaquinone biosynthesis C-methylase UbiE
MQFFNAPSEETALDARSKAQWIAFAPVVFQAAKSLRNTGILKTLESHKATGITMEEVEKETGISHYGVRVLLEAGLGMGLVYVEDDKYYITKTAYFILHDEMTNVNMNFIHDICYHGLFKLEESIRNGKPEGLPTLGNWNTIYEGLSKLPPHQQKSWFEFDHFYSDNAFPGALRTIFKTEFKTLLDIGGNTGKWAVACTRYNPEVHVTMMDLPGQLGLAKERIAKTEVADRISYFETNILNESLPFPKGFDAIWMSQFLDCFSDLEIESILKRCYCALNDGGHVFIMETFWDRQKFEAAAFSLQQTSLYFTAMANGNSQMYHSEVFKKLVANAGFEVTEQIDNIGLGHTILKCKKNSQ